MPFKPHLRITALGRLGSASGERFSYGLNMHAPADDRVIGLEADQDVWNDLAADVRAFHNAPTTRISATAVLEEVKFASIGADGRYTADPVIVNVADAPGGVAGADTPLPQSALAISLATARRGATGRGRFYIPMPVLVLSPADLLAPQVDINGIRANAVALIDNLNNQPGIDVLGLQVCVSSTKGYNSTVTGVRVGRVVDTVRSRRTSLPEDYGSTAAVAPA